MRVLLISLFTLFLFQVAAQSSDEELAAHYYNSGDYEKAVVLYKRLHKTKPSSVYIYENYLNSLIALNNIKESTSLVKKMIKKNPKSLNYKVDLGYVYDQMSKGEMAESHFEKLINEYKKDQYQISHLAQAFLKRQYTQWAIKCFEAGSDEHGLKYFWMSLMNMYRNTGEYQKATDIGLEVIKAEPRRMKSVAYQFSRMLEKEESADYIQQQTLVYSQKNPGIGAFDELLMQIYLEQKKFSAAFRQAKAMDLRHNEGGQRLLNLGQICVNNEAYDIASLCYQELIDKGRNSRYYIDGRVGFLNASFLNISSKLNTSLERKMNLISEYETFLNDFGYSRGTSLSMKRLAELYLFHIYETDKGISILSELLQIRNLGVDFAGESKLLLADAYLIKGEVWEAKLLYGQVDKEFKEDALGQEAKFRSARLSYFLGDFEWAKDQLDILKAATSQLISNNALDLALHIQDNVGLDTSYDAMTEFAHAEFLLFQNRLKECMDVLDILPVLYPNHSLEDEVLYLKARLMVKKKNFDEALKLYNEIYTNYSYDILADNALFQAAELYLDVMGDQKSALSLYEKLILDYNSSLYVVEARKKYEKLRSTLIP
ncbi:MAG: tetratricopeptide repeat protein [Bacteroidia bacterium]